MTDHQRIDGRTLVGMCLVDVHVFMHLNKNGK